MLDKGVLAIAVEAVEAVEHAQRYRVQRQARVVLGQVDALGAVARLRRSCSAQSFISSNMLRMLSGPKMGLRMRCVTPIACCRGGP